MLRRLLRPAHIDPGAPAPATGPATAPPAAPGAGALPHAAVNAVVEQYGKRKNVKGWYDSVRRVPVQRLKERALRRAAEAENADAVRILLTDGVSPVEPSHGERRDTALHRAAVTARDPQSALAAMLTHHHQQVEAGREPFDVNVRIPARPQLDLEGFVGEEIPPWPQELNTPLHEAVRAHNPLAVELLLDADGLDPSIRNAEGLTAHDLATREAMGSPTTAAPAVEILGLFAGRLNGPLEAQLPTYSPRPAGADSASTPLPAGVPGNPTAPPTDTIEPLPPAYQRDPPA